jgi:hypothetical protein
MAPTGGVGLIRPAFMAGWSAMMAFLVMGACPG